MVQLCPHVPFILRPRLILLASPHHRVRLGLAPASLPEQHCPRHHLRHRASDRDPLQVEVGTEVRQGSGCSVGWIDSSAVRRDHCLDRPDYHRAQCATRLHFAC
jgi:hypothetical protein